MVGMAGSVPAVDKKSKKKSEMEEGTGNANRVVLTKRDYIVVLDSEKSHLIFIPSRFHPNQVVEIKNLRVSLGDEVDLGDTIPITDGIHIGLLKGDVDLINKLMLPTEHLPRTFPDKKTAKLRSNELRVSKASKAKLGLRTRTVKNLSTYTGVVVGPWICEDRRDRGKLAAKIKLPGGTIGRLHVSELPSRLLIENTSPLSVF
ncbi:hypothetical protein KIN20_038285 [Parelaphostrongylus tenuis]|uniref:Uncharacterized protein n=1 Tax=Parelaphostrongylus tenuis TaxID=148309 RepID=A0AAD5REX9_PARTN|nr:hypothetical protein KIN20_038285 [Parelaphostrongylus tenuis]